MKIQNVNYLGNTSFCFRSSEQKSVCTPLNEINKIKVLGYGLGFSAAAIGGIIAVKKSMPSKYVKQLAKDLSIELKKEVKPSDLKCIASRNELLREMKSLKEQNYVASAENIKNGIFRADLHAHSNFSDGRIAVEDMMSQAAEYGNKLKAKTGKKFLFTLSDHDNVEGVKEALKIIANNPEKFKNVKFVPAAELSFAIECHPNSIKHHKTGNDVEIAEILIYDVNPFSETTKKYFNDLYSRRRQAITNSIKNANEKLPEYNFIEEEFTKFWPSNGDIKWQTNQHWSIYHYLNFKKRITDVAKANNQNPEELYDKIMTDFAKNRTNRYGQNLDKYFKEYNIEFSGETYDKKIVDLKNDLCPKNIASFIHAPSESSFTAIVDFAEKEKALLAFAHPGFTTQTMQSSDMYGKIKKFRELSKGNLICAEKYHQDYPIPKNITQPEIDECNKILDELKFINIGGRDNHTNNFTNFPY